MDRLTARRLFAFHASNPLSPLLRPHPLGRPPRPDPAARGPRARAACRRGPPRPPAPRRVVGAPGRPGRRVAAELERRGVAVRRASRPAFDWEDRATWAPALRGARAAYVAFVPDLAVPGADDAVGTFAALAADAGLERLVLLSGRGEHEAQRAEAAVRAAGVPTTVVRASWFMQNFGESFLLDALREGTVALPVDAAIA